MWNSQTENRRGQKKEGEVKEKQPAPISVFSNFGSPLIIVQSPFLMLRNATDVNVEYTVVGQM